ncbi:putative tyrosinase-like protein tyr-3 [Zancudomyces culisetae]|uniref:Putative tyrosinase-like protein tyr-3 n=1 Tax=Zancudomyces culisetae TaxID=1213189 RepID=A0A1R1PML3_ZANCU|nr:putative tyrosinase-like protein tyr-3 [Zancudomyces culisetae]|eukprot:OMH82196.1 putative tyrosinase-like protein tyr-3 [Zancudomyces culisetae]
MKLFTSLLALSSAITVGYAQECTNLLVRKEIRDLTSDEWSYHALALTRMNSNGWIKWFTRIHNENSMEVHGNSMFLPWHRNFINEFEQTTRRYYPEFTLPYWDSARDYSSPMNSEVLTYRYVGGNGDPDNNFCITNGPFKNWNLTYPDDASCLTRNFTIEDGKMPPWQSPEEMTYITQTFQTYEVFAMVLEQSLHASIHNAIGGMLPSMNSPNDMIFYLHHSNIDRLWWRWQNLVPNGSTLYDGINYDNSTALVTDKITYFGNTVESILEVGKNGYCYTYQENTPVQKRSAGGSSGADAVITNPKMNLATALPLDVLKKYFPKLTADGTSSFAVDLPNTVSTRAVQFAQKYDRMVNRSAAGALIDNRNAKLPVVGRTIADSTVITANTINLSTSPVTGDDKLADQYKMPYPAAIPESQLKMNNLNLDDYNKYLKNSKEFIDALNNAGYVSPYI